MTLSSTSLVQPEQFLLELWQQNQAAISRTLMASEADPAARQDLKQDIFLALHQAAGRLQAAEMPRAYLFRIVHNVTVDHIARAQRHKWQPLDDEIQQSLLNDCPSEQLGEQQQSQQLMQAVRRLSPANRQVILLAMEDLYAPEIADILQIAVCGVVQFTAFVGAGVWAFCVFGNPVSYNDPA